MVDRSSSALSFFGWLDYDERDAQQMREVFSAFNDKDTIDSLGLGVIRDSLSDQLFPGISTIQTRARYFVFVPWICQMLEADGVSLGQFNDRLRKLEVGLIKSLREREGPNQGVIGYVAEAKLTRLPSTVYWNGLRAFGIRQLGLTIAEYRGIVSRFAEMKMTVRKDDDGELVSARRRMWDPNLPPPPARFPHEAIPLTLTQDESDYLVDKIITHCSDTMLGELARNLSIDRSAPTPWEVPLTNPPKDLANLLWHSRNFSELMEGAQALYNLLLARRAERDLGSDTAVLQKKLVHQLEGWAAQVELRHSDFTDWMCGETFWHLIKRTTKVPLLTQRFIREWSSIVLADPKAIATSESARNVIISREFRLKGKLARLTDQRALEGWSGDPFSVTPMTFRWGNARRILDDLQHVDGA